MSTKFFDTKKSGLVKKTKTGIIAMTIFAVTAAAGVGGYKLMNRSTEERSQVETKSNYSSTNTNSYQAAPETRSTSNFSSFGFGSADKSAKATPAKKHEKGKHVAKHSKKRHGKHYAKHSKKKHGKHVAKHSKKRHGKHYAKHGKKKHGKHVAKHKKKKKVTATTASR